MTDKVKILIVEDEQYLLTLFRFALTMRSVDFDIITAVDGETALDLAHAIKPDLILLDILLPGSLDGIDVCRAIRTDPDMRGVGIVMVTALDDPLTRQRAIEAGAADYWLKPINTRNLLDRVRAVLSIKRMPVARPAGPEPMSATSGQLEAKPVSRLDAAIASIRTTFADLEPQDWAEIQALVEARAAYKKTSR